MERVKYHSELHNHDTIGSLLDGFGTPKEMMDRCEELGIYGYATTNHGTEYSLYYFAEIEGKYNTKTLYGIEFYECDDHTVQDPDNKYYHLLVIAKNDKGITALHQLTTLSEFEGKYYKPRIDLEQLKPYANDLIIGSACLASKLNRGTYEDMKRSALEYKEIFGDNFYLELQAHTSDDQIQYNKKLMKLHYDTGIPYIITSDSHYVKKEDALKHSKFINVNRNNADITTIGEIYENCYLHSTDEMYEIMFQSGLTEDEITIGLQNTNYITDICNGKVKFGNPELPEVQIPEEFKNSKEYFLHLIYQGWKDRNMEEQIKNDTRHTREDYMARLEKEINVISEMGFIDYHLIVADYMQWTVNQGIPTGFGRGSGAGAMVNYLLKITNINPMLYDLIFERYLNPERISLPDIDSDFSSADRYKVINYLKEKYGQDYVAQIINLSKFKPKVAIADAGRMNGISTSEVNALKEFMTGDTIEESIEDNMKNTKFQELLHKHADTIDLAKSFEGKVKTIGINACGTIISSKPIYDYCGMKQGEDDEQLLQVDKVICEKLGMVKMDILGVKVLDLINMTLQLKGINYYDFVNNIDFNDEKVYDFIAQGLTCGIFQLESYNMTKFFTRLKPKNLEDLCLGISAYRPGSMQYVDDIINRKDGLEEVQYDDDCLEPVLKNTYGIAVYQEQIMQMLQVMAGFSYGRADVVRRGLAKKHKEYILAQRDAFLYGEVKMLNEFNNDGTNVIKTYEEVKKTNTPTSEYEVIIEGCLHRGVKEEIALKIFSDLENWASYGLTQ